MKKYIVLVLFILSLFLSSCMSIHGLYPENAFRNSKVKAQMEREHWQGYVK